MVETWKKIGYHATTLYFLLGEIVRKITGKTISKFFRDELGSKSEINYSIMLPKEFQSKYADIIPPPVSHRSTEGLKIDQNSVIYRVWGNPDLSNVHDNSKIWWEIETRGFGNARSVAKIGSIIACWGLSEGKTRILKKITVEKSIEEQIYDRDMVLGNKTRFGLGWGLKTKYHNFPSERVAFWGGA